MRIVDTKRALILLMAFIACTQMASALQFNVNDSINGGTWADSSIANARGWRVMPNITIANVIGNNITIYGFTLEANSLLSRCYVRNDANDVTYATTTALSGDVITFATPVNASNGTAIRILCDSNGGGSVNGRRLTGETLPQTDTNFTWISGANENLVDDGFAILSINYSMFVPVSMEVNLSYPPNNVVLNGSIGQSLNATAIPATSAFSAVNATMCVYTNAGALIGCNFTTSVANNKTNFSMPALQDGTFRWFINFGVNNGETVMPAANFTFTLDTTRPVINNIVPSNNSYVYTYNQSSASFNVNATITESNPSACWINSTFNPTNTFVTCGVQRNVNTTNIFGQHTIFYCANDTVGNLACNSSNIIIPKVDYSTTTTIGNSETFTINVSALFGKSISQITLVYNGSSYTATIDEDSADNSIGTRQLFIPSFSFNTNVSFFWRITNSDSSVYNSSNYNQTINTIQIGSCASLPTKLFNLTVYDEELKTIMPAVQNASIEAAVNVYTSDRSSLLINQSATYINNTASICISNSLGVSSNYSLDMIVKYMADDYSIEYYNVERYILNASTTNANISLYDLLLADATEFKITVTSEGFVPVPGAIIFIERYYVGEDSFTLVELPKTDSEGKTLAHLVLNNIIYNMRAYKDGVLIKELDNVWAFCQVQAAECIIEIDQTEGSSNIPDYFFAGITFSPPQFDPVDNETVFSFVAPDGVPRNVSIEVVKNDVFGNRSVCSNSVVSASGTLICSMSGNLEEVTLTAGIYVDGVLIATKAFSVNEGDGYGSIGFIVWFFFTIVMILMVVDTKNGVLIMLVVSYAGAVTLGIAEGDLIGVGAAGIWIVTASIIGIWRINRFNQQ